MAGITLIQQGGQAGGDNGGAGIIGYGSPTTAGNTLFVVGFWYNNLAAATTISSITDDAGNSWQFSTATLNQNPPVASTSPMVSFVAWCFNAASTSSVTLTPAASDTGNIWWRVTIGELSGAAGIDTAGAATGTGTTASVNLNLSQSGDFVVSAFDDGSANITSNPAGWTVFTSSGFGNGYATPGAGPYDVAYGLSASDTWAVAAAAFKPAQSMTGPMTVTGTFPANEWSDGFFTSVYVLTGAKKAAAQTGAQYGTLSSSGDSGTGSITTTVAASWVLGGASNPFGNVDPATGVSGTTVLDNTGPASPDGTNFCTFYSPSLTAGAHTVGITDTGSSTIALAEILTNTTIALDPSGPSPAWADDFGADNTSTTATFTPIAGALLVAVLGADANAGHSSSDIQISDTAGPTWRQLAFGNSSSGMIMSVFVADVPGATNSTPSLLMTGII